MLIGDFSDSTKCRIIYVTSDDSNSQVDCPVDHCYHLQEVVGYLSQFDYSYKTLELLPGTYNITEKVGQLILVDVENFVLRGSSSNVSIICQPGATFGLVIIKNKNVEISNLEISHCSAKLLLKESHSAILKGYNRQIVQSLGYNLSLCDANANSHRACYTFLTSFENKNVTIYETAVLYSRGVGIFSLHSKDFNYISKTVLAYNQINCIHLMRLNISTNFNMSQSQIKFGLSIAMNLHQD